jgi:hypothetical protein
MTELAVSAEVIDGAVEARRQYNLSLGDARIAATALVHRLPLVTHNLRDFERVADLQLIDPLEG